MPQYVSIKYLPSYLGRSLVAAAATLCGLYSQGVAIIASTWLVLILTSSQPCLIESVLGRAAEVKLLSAPRTQVAAPPHATRPVPGSTTPSGPLGRAKQKAESPEPRAEGAQPPRSREGGRCPLPAPGAPNPEGKGTRARDMLVRLRAARPCRSSLARHSSIWIAASSVLEWTKGGRA
jgi:hypothetical protein